MGCKQLPVLWLLFHTKQLWHSSWTFALKLHTEVKSPSFLSKTLLSQTSLAFATYFNINQLNVWKQSSTETGLGMFNNFKTNVISLDTLKH